MNAEDVDDFGTGNGSFGGVSGGELFVGEQRRELVDELVAAFEDVSETGVPRWVSMEAPSGWGKSRIAQEFYSRLAIDFQDDGWFWPSSILDGVDLSSLEQRRKRVYPETVVPEPGSTPAWFWWGFGCDNRYGLPLETLQTDIEQFEKVKPGLEARWRRDAPRRKRAQRKLVGKPGELAETAGSEAAGAALAAAHLAVPGLGFVTLAAKWTYQGIKNRRADDELVNKSADLAEETAVGVATFAREALPVVIFVEDLHNADEQLVELLRHLLVANNARVLVVTTAWPGTMQQPNRAANTLWDRVPADRRVRWTTSNTDDTNIELTSFRADELMELTVANLPGASPVVHQALVDRYENPLALQLACASRKLSRAMERGRRDDQLVKVIASMPTEVRDLFKSIWDELPKPVRTMCMLAALSTPSQSNEWGAGDDRWDHDAVIAAATTMPWLQNELNGLDARLRDSGDVYGWVREVSSWLRRFHEPTQKDLVITEAKDHFDDDELGEYFDQLVQRLATGDDIDDATTLHHQRLIVSLQAEGFIERNETWTVAAIGLCKALAQQPDTASNKLLIGLAEQVVASIADPDNTDHLDLRNLQADSLGELGQLDDAIVMSEQLLADRQRVLGDDHPNTLTTRGNLASWLGEVGRVDDAIVMSEQLLTDQQRVLGDDHPNTLTTRNNLAFLLGQAGRVDDAIVMFEQLLADLQRVLGDDHPNTLNSRNNLASLLGEVGRVDDAIVMFEQLLADRQRVLGEDHPDTLGARNNLAGSLGEVGRVDDAIVMFEQVLADLQRVLGDDHPKTLTARNNLAYFRRQAGQTTVVKDKLSSTPRNASCPCGSGKKFKRCCIS